MTKEHMLGSGDGSASQHPLERDFTTRRGPVYGDSSAHQKSISGIETPIDVNKNFGNTAHGQSYEWFNRRSTGNK